MAAKICFFIYFFLHGNCGDFEHVALVDNDRQPRHVSWGTVSSFYAILTTFHFKYNLDCCESGETELDRTNKTFVLFYKKVAFLKQHLCFK